MVIYNRSLNIVKTNLAPAAPAKRPREVYKQDLLNLLLMIKTYKFRIYPNRKQEIKLNHILELSRFTYNKQLELKIKKYKEDKNNLTYFDLNSNLSRLKEEYPKLKQIHSQVLQNIDKRISLAFNNFFRRIKNKETVGFPRFKSKNRYDSITYPQSGFKLERRLYISKIGIVNITKHRQIQGKIRTLTIKKTPSNKWFTYFCVECEKTQKIQLTQDKQIGIDLGLNHFYATSEGNLIRSPRYSIISENKLRVLCRQHSKKIKGSKNRQRSRLRLAKMYEKISNQRLDFLHKESRKLVNRYSMIAVEKLNIKNLQKNKYLAKFIADASWNKFIQLLSYKVEETGGELVKINPRGTSQYCICGNKVQKRLSTRIHNCDKCGTVMNRDIMSAILIKDLAFNGTTVGSTGCKAFEDASIETSMN